MSIAAITALYSEDINGTRTQKDISTDETVAEVATDSASTKSPVMGDKVTLSQAAIDLSQSPILVNNEPPKPRVVRAQTLQELSAELGRRTDAEVALADKEVPNSTDPARLARAKAATAAIYRQGPNPFEHLSRTNLRAIIEDDSGAYTQNERNAALLKQSDLDYQFWSSIAANAQQTGDWRQADVARIAFYKQLSPLEKTEYPANYIAITKEDLSKENIKHGGPLSDTLLAELEKKYNAMRNESFDRGSDNANNRNSINKPWSAILKELGLGED